MTKSDLVFGLALLDYLKETQPKTISEEQLKEIKNEVRLLVDKQQKKYENIVDKYSHLQDKYIKQKDNWNKLKKYIKTEIPEDVFINTEWFVSILDKMQELEKGSNKE